MIFTVIKNALIPNDDEAHKRMAAFTIGEWTEVQIPHARNQVFANCTALVFSRLAAAREVDQRTIRGLLAILTGRSEMITHGGKAYRIPHGTGPRDMNATEFEVFWEDVAPLIEAEFLPHMRPEVAADIRDIMARCSP